MLIYIDIKSTYEKYERRAVYLAKEPMRDSGQLQMALEKQHSMAINFLTLGRGPKHMSRPRNCTNQYILI